MSGATESVTIPLGRWARLTTLYSSQFVRPATRGLVVTEDDGKSQEVSSVSAAITVSHTDKQPTSKDVVINYLTR